MFVALPFRVFRGIVLLPVRVFRVVRSQGFHMIHPENNKQLFLDDYAIESMEDLTRTLHPVDKQGPVIEPDESVGQLAVQSNSPPIWNPDKGLYEWWFGARYSAPAHGRS